MKRLNHMSTIGLFRAIPANRQILNYRRSLSAASNVQRIFAPSLHVQRLPVNFVNSQRYNQNNSRNYSTNNGQAYSTGGTLFVAFVWFLAGFTVGVSLSSYSSPSRSDDDKSNMTNGDRSLYQQIDDNKSNMTNDDKPLYQQIDDKIKHCNRYIEIDCLYSAKSDLLEIVSKVAELYSLTQNNPAQALLEWEVNNFEKLQKKNESLTNSVNNLIDKIIGKKYLDEYFVKKINEYRERPNYLKNNFPYSVHLDGIQYYRNYLKPYQFHLEAIKNEVDSYLLEPEIINASDALCNFIIQQAESYSNVKTDKEKQEIVNEVENAVDEFNGVVDAAKKRLIQHYSQYFVNELLTAKNQMDTITKMFNAIGLPENQEREVAKPPLSP